MLKDGKPVLLFVAVKRKDNGQWAIPGVKGNKYNNGREVSFFKNQC